ncbi:copper chaperone PCu(A)C [Streptomyces sp. NPDC006997]|uniref:copper chaperone PCu(A)C n=1 Tax=Streptomyces sp. NPDC006997 TaxID=3155356 RepID=UPI0033DE15A7
MFARTTGVRRRAIAFLTVVCLAALGTAGCAGDDKLTHNPPGANARIGPVLIRYAHLAEPPDDPWQRGADVPFYLWLFNQGQRADRLLGAETTVAESVAIVSSDGAAEDPVPLPPGELVELEKGRTHLLLKGLKQQIRGGDYVWITLRFERAGEIALQVHSQIPTRVDDEATAEPGLTSPSPDE